MIQLHITMNSKDYHPSARWQGMGEDTRSFPDKKAAKEWIRETYGKAKRAAMYIDRKDGPPERIGYVIGSREADYSHAPIRRWLQQDWIEFREVRSVSPFGIKDDEARTVNPQEES